MGEVAERSEDGEGKKAAIPSQSPAVTALPEGEPRGCTPENGPRCFSAAGALLI